MIDKLNVIGTQSKMKSVLDILSCLPTRTFEKGDYILGKGKYFEDNILFVVKGKGILYSKKTSISKDIANGYFLANSFLNLNTMNTSTINSQKEYAIAASSVMIKIISLIHFQQLLETNNVLRKFVIQELLQTAQRTQEELIKKATLSSNYIILHFLLNLVKREGKRVGYEWVIHQPFSMIQIGKLTHTSRQSSSTLLNKLKRKGIIHFNRKYLIIRSLKKLEALIDRPTLDF